MHARLVVQQQAQGLAHGRDVVVYDNFSAGHHGACDALAAVADGRLTVVEGDIAAHMFLPESLERPSVQRLIAVSDGCVDDQCEALYPGRRSGAVTITLKNGRQLEARVLDPKGEGENPMTDGDLQRKFTVNCEPVIGKSRAAGLLETVWSFERVAQLSELMCWV